MALSLGCTVVSADGVSVSELWDTLWFQLMMLMALSLGCAVVSTDGFNLMVLTLGCIAVSSNSVGYLCCQQMTLIWCTERLC